MSRDGEDSRPLHFDTRAARAAKDVRPAAGTPTSVPIVASSGFEQADTKAIDDVFGGGSGYVYGRYHNPTVEALESAVADLEGAPAVLAYGSGMAAIAGAFAALELESGAVIVAARDLYGSTITWLEAEARRSGWSIRYADLTDAEEAARAAADEGVSAVYCETLSNPLVRVVDLDAVGAACRDAGVALIVDATYTPPNLIRTLEHGATLAVHSATKYLGGHGDVVAGVLAGPAEMIDAARARRTLDGTIADPFTAWLVLRGIKTLPLRAERQCDNAARIAAFLEGHDRVEQVHYPGVGCRDTERERDVLRRLFPGGRYGAMLAFDLAGDESDEAARVARGFLDALRVWGKATTLGDLESLTLIPAMTSHRRQSPETRAAMGISDATVRLSVGIENVDDLIADLAQALARI